MGQHSGKAEAGGGVANSNWQLANADLLAVTLCKNQVIGVWQWFDLANC
jgi:hypothetical protein